MCARAAPALTKREMGCIARATNARTRAAHAGGDSRLPCSGAAVLARKYALRYTRGQTAPVLALAPCIGGAPWVFPRRARRPHDTPDAGNGTACLPRGVCRAAY